MAITLGIVVASIAFLGAVVLMANLFELRGRLDKALDRATHWEAEHRRAQAKLARLPTELQVKELHAELEEAGARLLGCQIAKAGIARDNDRLLVELGAAEELLNERAGK